MEEQPGFVTLDGEIVGRFEIKDSQYVRITFNKGSADVRETLEFASEQGMTLGLTLAPTIPE